MAVVQGIKEKVHLPIYDAIKVEAEEQLRKVERSGTLKFFVDVQGKTKLETNLQAAGLLPHYNTFEARAMRVVISDLPPEFPEEEPLVEDEEFDVTDEEDNAFSIGSDGSPIAHPGDTSPFVMADVELTLPDVVALIREAKDSEDGFAELPANDEAVILWRDDTEEELSDDFADALADNLGGSVWLSVGDLEAMVEDLGDEGPPVEQLRNGAASILSKFVYNTVTTFYVGEKVMIEMPTWFFPGGAGPYSEAGGFVTHGEPNPTATFRFSEPIFIDRQQNFRVEIDIPDADVLKEIQRIYGPLFIWVVLDGYMTRDVQ